MTFGLLFKSKSIHRAGAPAWWWGQVLLKKVSVSWVLPQGYCESSIWSSQSLLSLRCRHTLCTLLLILELGLCKAISLMLVCSLLGSASSVQFSSVAQLYPTLWDPVDCSTPGFPVHHQFSELAQTHVYRVGNAIQPSHPRVWKAGKGGRDFLLTICFLFLVYMPAVLASPWPVKQQFILVFNFSSHQESGLLHSFRNISTSWPALLLQRSGSSTGGFRLPASSYSNPHASFCFLSLKKDNCFLLGYLSVSFLPWLSSSTWLIVIYIKFFSKMLMWFSVSCQACLRHWPWLFLISLVECSRLCVCYEVGDEVHVQSLQSYYPMDCSPPGSSVHGILQARILKCVAMPSSRGSTQGSNLCLLHCRWILYPLSQCGSPLRKRI